MKMQQVIVQSARLEGVLIPKDNCDLGIVPRQGATFTIDMIMVGDEFKPVVTFHVDQNNLRVVFDTGIPTKPFDTASQRLDHFRKEAWLSVCQNEPHDPELYVCLNYEGNHFEAEVLMKDFVPFAKFPLRDDEPAEPDSSEILVEDRISA